MAMKLVSKWRCDETGERAEIYMDTDSMGERVYKTFIRGPISTRCEPSLTSVAQDHTAALKRLGFRKVTP